MKLLNSASCYHCHDTEADEKHMEENYEIFSNFVKAGVPYTVFFNGSFAYVFSTSNEYEKEQNLMDICEVCNIKEGLDIYADGRLALRLIAYYGEHKEEVQVVKGNMFDFIFTRDGVTYKTLTFSDDEKKVFVKAINEERYTIYTYLPIEIVISEFLNS